MTNGLLMLVQELRIWRSWRQTGAALQRI